MGLTINLAKSKLVPVDNVNNVEGLACIMGCRVSSFPKKYRGLPLSTSFKAKSIWNDIVESTLSKGHRIVLIKSTLSNVPTYFLSLFSPPD